MARHQQDSPLAASAAANPARVYDFLLGGKNNFAADQRAAKRLARDKPDLVPNVRANRAFLGRAVEFLAGGAGVLQFLDIGTGLPAMNNTHEVAQRVRPDARVVYVDNDREVLVHARALLTSTSEGTCAYVQADLRDPAGILAQAAETLDFTRPVAVMLLGILYMLPAADGPYEIVGHLMGATARGSYLAISHPASDVHAEQAARAAGRYGREIGVPQTNRSRQQVTQFFDGLELLDPGVVQANRWRPAPGDDVASELSNWCGVARKN